jgi:hypothetical protein
VPVFCECEDWSRCLILSSLWMEDDRVVMFVSDARRDNARITCRGFGGDVLNM